MIEVGGLVRVRDRFQNAGMLGLVLGREEGFYKFFYSPAPSPPVDSPWTAMRSCGSTVVSAASLKPTWSPAVPR